MTADVGYFFFGVAFGLLVALISRLLLEKK